MTPPVGVIISAGVQFLFSLGGLLITGVILITLKPWNLPPNYVAIVGLPPRMITYSLYFTATLFALVAIWSGSTGIGLLRLRSWARTSTIAMASLVGFVFGLLSLSPLAGTLQSHPDGDAMTQRMAMIALTGIAILFLALAVCWLVYYVLAVANFALAALSTLVFYCVPGISARSYEEMAAWEQRTRPFRAAVPQEPGAQAGDAFGIVVTAITVTSFTLLPLAYLLWYRKDYFAAVEDASQHSA